MPSAELIAIGTELLLGEIQDTNTRAIARMLREINVDLFRSTIIGDNSARIAALMIEALDRSDIVIATGGLGPTVDDPTREAAAAALHVDLEFHPDLWQEIQSRYSSRGSMPSVNNQRQAFIPATATIIHNPVGTAPSFILQKNGKSLICLPGVPREMETLMQQSVIPYLIKTYDLRGLIKVRVLHVSGVPESRVDQLVGDFETLQNPTVGLLAHPGVVDIRITAKANSAAEADQLISSLEVPIRERFGEDIFGDDDTTLLNHVLKRMAENSRVFVFLEAAEKPVIKTQFDNSSVIKRFEYSAQVPQIESITQNAEVLARNTPADVIFYFSHKQDENGTKCISGIISSKYKQQVEKIYRGPAANGDLWVSNTALDFIRRTLNKIDLREG